jgi:hypothetical protein
MQGLTGKSSILMSDGSINFTDVLAYRWWARLGGLYRGSNMTTVSRARTAAWALCAMAAFSSSPARSADRLYYFVDDHGVSHFSNVPGDPRYRPLPWTEIPTGPQPGLAWVPPTLSASEGIPRAVEPVMGAPEVAKGFAEPNTTEPSPEDFAAQTMFTDDTLTPGIEADPAGGAAEPQNR